MYLVKIYIIDFIEDIQHKNFLFSCFWKCANIFPKFWQTMIVFAITVIKTFAIHVNIIVIRRHTINESYISQVITKISMKILRICGFIALHIYLPIDFSLINHWWRKNASALGQSTTFSHYCKINDQP